MNKKSHGQSVFPQKETASVILAAGRGSRMKGFDGNKTLLPLIPGSSPYEGTHFMLLKTVNNLPHGSKAVVVNHKRQDVMSVTRGLGLTYCRQPVLNGTGGGLLAARSFLENVDSDGVLITMGDVPFVREATYRNLLHGLEDHAFVILGFRPEKKKRYGVLDIQKSCVRKIIEWKYWRAFPEKKQKALPVCNSGIYAAKRETLLRYLSILAKRPHKVQKEIDGEQKVVEEFFIIFRKRTETVIP